MKLTCLWVVVFCSMILAWSGCTTDQADGPAKGTNQPCRLDELHLGDLVTITFSDLPGGVVLPESKARIKEDGTLTLPMNLSVLAAGRSLGVVEKEIVDLYVPKWYRQLSVTLKTEEKWYSVGGEVKQPGRQAYLGPTTVLRAIQSCGDFTDFAQRKKVELHRANGQREIVDCKKARTNSKYDLPVCPGDAIIVPRRLM